MSQGPSSLFRGEAFEYHFREQESRGVLNTSMRHPWPIALASMLLLSVALTYILVTRVEVVYRAEGAMKLETVQGGARGARLAIAYVHGTPDLVVTPGTRVRLELLRPTSAASQFIDGRLGAASRAPTRLEISLDQAIVDQPRAGGGDLIPIRIHAVGCQQSLWRFMLSTNSRCPQR